MKLNGFFDCKKSRCTKLNKPPTKCDRYCPKVTTTAVNVLLMIDDSIVTAECDVGFAYNEAKGNQHGVRLEERKPVWNEHDGILLTNCYTAVKDGDKLKYNEPFDNDNVIQFNLMMKFSSFSATDCINGTLLPDNIIPKPFMNFTQFWKIYNNSKNVVDATDK